MNQKRRLPNGHTSDTPPATSSGGLDAFFEAQRSRVARRLESHIDRVRRQRFDAEPPDTEDEVPDAEM